MRACFDKGDRSQGCAVVARPRDGSVSTCTSWRIPVVVGYAAARFRGMKRDTVPIRVGMRRTTVARYVRSFAFICVICLICSALRFALMPIMAAQLPQPNDDRGRIVPIGSALCEEMKRHHVLGENPPVGCERLKLVRFAYVGFDMALHEDGELVVMDAAAPHVSRIFNTLRDIRFPIAKARLMNHYDGNDAASMADNNTSAFNDRMITEGDAVSLHAYGLAIDINPVQNPYVVRTGEVLTFQPPAGVEYANRLNDRPWKESRPGMAEAVIDVFAENGFLIWGGYWDNPIDYQHFQVGRKMAERLARSSPAEAEMIFGQLVERYRACRQSPSRNGRSNRAACIMAADPTGG